MRYALLLSATLQCSLAKWLLQLAPAQLAPLAAVYNESMSSWGGSVVEDASDPVYRFHMFHGICA